MICAAIYIFFDVLFFIAAAAATTVEPVHQHNMPYGKTTLSFISFALQKIKITVHKILYNILVI